MKPVFATSSETNFLRTAVIFDISTSVTYCPKTSLNRMYSFRGISSAKLVSKKAGSSLPIINSLMCMRTRSNRSNLRQSSYNIWNTVSATLCRTSTPLRKKRSKTSRTVSSGILFTKILTIQENVISSVLNSILSKCSVSCGYLCESRVSTIFMSTKTP